MLKRLYIVVLTIFSVNAIQASALSDVELMHKALVELHPGYLRYQTHENAEQHLAKLKAFAATKPSKLKLAAEIQGFLSNLRCDHTLIELPKDLRSQKKQRFAPFHIKNFENRLYISHSEEPLKRGDEIIAINGVPTPDIIAKLSPYVSYDGFNSHVITDYIVDNSDVLGSYFEVLFAPVVLGLDEYPETLDLVVENINGIKSTHTLSTIDFKRWQELSGKPYRQNFKDAVSVKYQGNTAILTVDTFVNYREPVHAKRKFQRIFKEFREKKINTLIVDLRNNGGGSDDAQFALLTHLIKTPIKINTKAWIKGNKHTNWRNKLNTWDKSIFDIDYDDLKPHPEGYELPANMMGQNYKTSKPARYNFRGKVIMLTSRANSSGSAAALGILAEQPHITTLGQKTGGNLGGTTASIITFLTLPDSGIRVRIPLIRNLYNIENVKDGYGLTPDIEVEQNYEDWLAGKDTSLSRALATSQAISD